MVLGINLLKVNSSYELDLNYKQSEIAKNKGTWKKYNRVGG